MMIMMIISVNQLLCCSWSSYCVLRLTAIWYFGQAVYVGLRRICARGASYFYSPYSVQTWGQNGPSAHDPWLWIRGDRSLCCVCGRWDMHTQRPIPISLGYTGNLDIRTMFILLKNSSTLATLLSSSPKTHHGNTSLMLGWDDWWRQEWCLTGTLNSWRNQVKEARFV